MPLPGFEPRIFQAVASVLCPLRYPGCHVHCKNIQISNLYRFSRWLQSSQDLNPGTHLWAVGSGCRPLQPLNVGCFGSGTEASGDSEARLCSNCCATYRCPQSAQLRRTPFIYETFPLSSATPRGAPPAVMEWRGDNASRGLDHQSVKLA